MHKNRGEQHERYENEYAEKFFEKKMNPGLMGKGFIGENEQGRKGKVKKLFPNLNDLT